MAIIPAKVSSYGINSKGRNHAATVMGKMVEKQRLISEGGNKDNFAEISQTHEISAVLANQIQLSAINERRYHLEGTLKRMEYSESTLRSIIDTLDEATKSLYTAYNPVDGSSIDVVAFANNTLNQLENLLNSNFDGVFLFGGRDSISAPVQDLAGANNLDADWDFNANYYTGDDSNTLVRLNDTVTVEIPIQANDNPFVMVIGALNMAKQEGGQTTPDTDVYRRAIGFINDAKSELAGKLTTLGNRMKEVEQQIQLDETQGQKLQSNLDGIMKHDETQLILEATQLMSMVVATIKLISMISDPSLQVANHIRL